MELAVFEQLLTPTGQLLLASAMELQPSEKTFLAAYEKLRKRTSPELAKAAVETAILRAKGAAKFPDAAQMYFTREALEQSSSASVASYRANRYRGFDIVGDLCCGIGGDAQALSAIVPNVIAFDSDPLKARMAAENTKALALAADVLKDELHTLDAFFCDPSRRADGKRFLSLADYLPSPRAVLERLPNVPGAFKLAPGVPLEDLHEFDGEAEFISLGGELKECVLWLNGLQTNRFRATVLPSGQSIAADEPDESPETGDVLRFVYDPDPSLTRSGLLANFAQTVGARMIDPSIAFMTAEQSVASPFATVYEVEESIPFHAKRLTEFLRSRNVGRVTPVKRGSNVDTDALLRQLKLRGDEHRTILFTRRNDQQVAIVANRIGS